MAHPLETILQSTVSELNNLVDVNTIVGAPVQLGDGTMIIPVSRVTLGFVSGGGEYGTKNPVLQSGAALDSGTAYPFAGTLAAGMGVTPVSFLTVAGGRVSVLPAQENEPLARIVSMLPELMSEARQMIASLQRDKRAQ